MKIVIFGATGRTGVNLLNQALELGYKVTAFVRNPTQLKVQHQNLLIFRGDVFNRQQVEKAVVRKEAVLSVLGVRNGPKNVCSSGIKNIIFVMKKHKIKRIIAESAFGAGETKNYGFYARSLWVVIKDIMEDKNRMEEIVKKSGLDWIIVRPTALTGGAKTGKYKVGKNLKLSLYPKISRADVADFMLKNLTSNKFLHQTPTISY